MEGSAIRQALRQALHQRGYEVGGDTAGWKGELYVKGEGDLAAALFEFKATAQEAFVTMYHGQGRWLSHLPPRFAVLPVAEKDGSTVELLTQCGLSALFYDDGGEDVVFPDLDQAVALFKAGGQRED